MRLFRPRSATVEAMQYDGTNEAEIAAWRGYDAYMRTGEWLVRNPYAPSNLYDEFVYLSDEEMMARFEPVVADSLL